MPDTTEVFTALAGILRKHAKGLVAKVDTAEHLYLDVPASDPKKKPEFFGAAQIKKSYVSYHLMPVYTDPTLLDGLSPELRARMQGKSCFNFKTVEPKLFKELDALTKACRATVNTA